MTKTKKTLALVMAVVMCFTMMIGCLTISADNPGLITVGTTTIDEGTASATVNVSISGAAFAAGQITLSYNTALGTPAVASSSQYLTTNTATAGKVYLIIESGASTIENISSGSFTLTFSNLSSLAAGDYNITVDAVDFADYDENTVDFTTADGKVTVQAVVQHTHSFVGTVTKQPTYTETGIMTYTCGCGESYTEDIDIPTQMSLAKSPVSQALVVDATVGVNIGINRGAKNGVLLAGYSDCFVVVEYESYNDNYNKEMAQTVFYSTDPHTANAAGTVYYYTFDRIALFEMGLNYTVTVYGLDENGVVTGYYTTDASSVQAQALAYIAKYSSDAKLVTALVDMVNYGASVQEYFATSHPTADIALAALPTIGFEDYQQFASEESSLPDSFNNTKSLTKNVSTTAYNGAGTMVIASSNQASFTILDANRDDAVEKSMKAVISYVDSYGDTISDEVFLKDITPSSTSKGLTYKFLFAKLAIYDLNETISVELYKDGIVEATYNYSLGNFINSNINNASLSPVLKAGELFAASVRAKLIG